MSYRPRADCLPWLNGKELAEGVEKQESTTPARIGLQVLNKFHVATTPLHLLSSSKCGRKAIIRTGHPHLMVHTTLSQPLSLSNSMLQLLTKTTSILAHDRVWKAMWVHRAPFLSTGCSKATVEIYRRKEDGGLRSEPEVLKENRHY